MIVQDYKRRLQKRLRTFKQGNLHLFGSDGKDVKEFHFLFTLYL